LLHSHSTGGEVWHFAGPDGEESVHVSGNVISNSAVALRLAALHGQGLHRTPSFLVEDDLRSGQLVTVLNEFLGTEQAIDVFYPSRKYLPAKVRSFVDLLVEYFRDDATHDDATQPPGFASIPRKPRLRFGRKRASKQPCRGAEPSCRADARPLSGGMARVKRSSFPAASHRASGWMRPLDSHREPADENSARPQVGSAR
jgi:LysR substrate binding domain